MPGTGGRSIALAVATSLLAALAAVCAAPPAVATGSSATVAHVAGDRVSSGEATGLGQFPAELAMAGSTLVIRDDANSQVRQVALATGQEQVVYGDGQGAYGGPIPTSNDDGTTIPFVGGLVAASSDGKTYIWIPIQHVIVTVNSDGSMTVRDAPALPCSTLCNAMAAASDGTLYLTGGTFEPQVYRISPNNATATIAGTTQPGHSGDGGPATSARLEDPVDVVVDAVGNVDIADGGGRWIRKVDTNGTITTIAGTGTSGDTGDGGAALSAQIAASHLDIASTGILYFVDTHDDVVRRIALDGTISRYAGLGPGGMGTPEPYPNDFADGYPALQTGLLQLGDLAIGSDGSVYVAQLTSYAGVVRRIDPLGSHLISTVAGNGSTGFGGGTVAAPAPSAPTPQLAVTSTGDPVVAGTDNRAAYLVHPDTSAVDDLIGDGACCDWSSTDPHAGVLGRPEGVAIAGDGTVYVSDPAPIGRISALHPDGTWSVVADWVPSGSPVPAGVIPISDASFSPGPLAVDARGRVYFSQRCSIQRIANGHVEVVAGEPNTCENTGWGGQAAAAHVGQVGALSVDQKGRLLFSSVAPAADGARTGRIETDGTLTDLCHCAGAAITTDSSDEIFVDGIYQLNLATRSLDDLSANSNSNIIGRYDTGDGGSLGASRWYNPTACVVAPSGVEYVADGGIIRSITGLATAAVPPTAPEQLEATLGADGTLRARWSPPASTGGDLPHSYALTLSPGGESTTVSGLSASITGLNPSVHYTATVEATNAAGTGPSDSASAVGESTLTTSPASQVIVAGSSAMLHARLMAFGEPKGGVALDLQSRGADGLWHLAGHVTTDGEGRVTTAVSPVHNRVYRWRWDGSASTTAATGPAQSVLVRAVVAAHAWKDNTNAFHIAGTVRPVLSGIRVWLQVRTSTGWHGVTSKLLDRRSQYTFRVGALHGTGRYRVHLVRSSTNLAATSRSLSLTLL